MIGTEACLVGLGILWSLWMIVCRRRDSKPTIEECLAGHGTIQRGVPTHIHGTGETLYCDVIRLDPIHDQDVQQRKVYFFIPGNPGMIDFYLTMMTSIFEREDRNVYVCAVGHVGHSPWSLGKVDRFVSFEEQIQHKVDFIRQNFPWLATGQGSVHIIGHSVGANIGLNLIHRMPELNVQQFFGICPAAIHIGESPGGKAYMNMFGSSFARGLAFYTVAVLKVLLHMLPETISLALVHFIMSLGDEVDKEFVPYAKNTIDPHVVGNALHMAHEEMQTIGPEKHLHDTVLKDHMHKFHFIHAPIDKWCDPPILEKMKDVFHASSFRIMSEDLQHAFCLSHEGVSTVVEAIFSAESTTSK